MLQEVFNSIFRRPLREALTLYAYALTIVAVGMTCRAVLHPFLGNASFAVTLLSVLTAAWICGVGPCLLVQTLVILIESNAYPRNNGEPRTLSSAVVGIGVFYFVGLAMALLSEFTRIARLRAVREAENANRERERLLATLNCVADAVLVTDARGLVTLANPVAETLLGKDAAKMLGQPLANVLVLRSEQGEAIRSPLDQVMHAGKTVHCDASLHLRRDDGSLVPVSLSASPVRDGHSALGNVFLLHDQSERVRIEQDLREADRRKDEFLATLAHELRNPLAPIRTGLELLKVCNDDPELFDDVRGRMERQTIHMIRLIDDLLDISRITRGKLKLNRGTVQLAPVVRCAVEAVQPLIDERRHELSVSLPDQPVWWHVDEHRVAQIISNLLSNAAKFTPPGGKIQLTAAQAGDAVVIRVSDTGPGIPDEMQERIFEMFSQLQRTMENGSSGLGIGLTLVKTLVEMHGGTICVANNSPEPGAEFTIELAACQAPSESPIELASQS